MRLQRGECSDGSFGIVYVNWSHFRKFQKIQILAISHGFTSLKLVLSRIYHEQPDIIQRETGQWNIVILEN